MICQTLIAVAVAYGGNVTTVIFKAEDLPQVVARNPDVLLSQAAKDAYLLPSLPKFVQYKRAKCGASTTELVDGIP